MRVSLSSGFPIVSKKIVNLVEFKERGVKKPLSDVMTKPFLARSRLCFFLPKRGGGVRWYPFIFFPAKKKF